MQTSHGGSNDATSQVLFGLDPFWMATAVFVLSYVVIMTERINRAVVALIGAGLLIVLGILPQSTAVAGIDFNTIGLLTGMMVIVAISRQSGVFQYLAIKSAKWARGRPWGILVMLSIVTAVLSALLDNVTTVLLIVPVALLICDELEINPYPILLALIMASNVGGTATLIGDPPNIMIGTQTDLTFNDFLFNLAPIVPLIFVATLVPLYLIYGRYMGASEEGMQRVMAFRERDAITDPGLLKRSLFVVGLVVLGFIMHHSLGLQPATVAMFGAALLLLLYTVDLSPDEASERVHNIFAEVEWVTIFFFVGLFMLVAGIEHVGLLEMLADEVMAATGGDFQATSFAIMWVSAVASAIVDNIPFVATLIPMIKSMLPAFQEAGLEGASVNAIWWSLALGACLGGNGSLIGASANLITAGFAERAGHPIRFLPFLAIAFPMMLLQVAIASVYVWYRYF
ncbi:MAG: SLC13 family permease [Thiohalorhabdus sp.]|uniref:SLC13 family permease n=1 Tax=Thiohalorhabdus sp. TaxID=3094134 RepID=UPI00397FBD4C